MHEHHDFARDGPQPALAAKQEIDKLTLLATDGRVTIETVRAWVSPLGTDYPGWLQLRRWADDAHRLPEISSGQPRSPPEQFARSVVQQIAASSPDGREFPLWKRAVWQAAPSNHAR